jgi:Xaa-Pro aminopeptidase
MKHKYKTLLLAYKGFYMKKLLIGLTLFASMSSFAIDWPAQEVIDHEADMAFFETELWFCEASEAFAEGMIAIHTSLDQIAEKQCEDAKRIEKNSNALITITKENRTAEFLCSEEHLTSVQEIESLNESLGCDATIRDAKKLLSKTEIKEILEDHLEKRIVLEAFEAEVKSGKTSSELVSSVRILQENSISFRLVKMHIPLSYAQLNTVDYSFLIANIRSR